jgi:hypothetical protein
MNLPDELTTLKVTKDAAAELKRRFPHLRNDAVRLSVLLGVVKVEDLPRPSDAQAVPLVTIDRRHSERRERRGQ